jgi:hypothetical protein
LKTPSFFSPLAGSLLVVLLIAAPLGLLAQTLVERLSNFDRRLEARPSRPTLEADRSAALEALQASYPGLRVVLHPVTASPAWIHNADGFLTGPDSEDEVTHPRLAGASVSRPTDPHRRIKEFLNDNPVLFGHGSEILAGARVTREYVTEHNGLRTVVWEQDLDGIPVFEGTLCGHITKNGELASLSSQFVPAAARAADAGVPNRSAVASVPPVSARQAVAVAAGNISEPLRAEDVTTLEAAIEDPMSERRFAASYLRGEATARLVWLRVTGCIPRRWWRPTGPCSSAAMTPDSTP